ncbi:hypothetical protein RVR_5333 [Actinacidiphila reveromycinica]|uniref:Uncharacterized protein n=1 Tax=Actinacidiphila reveromycinica TaxID=659352 RepID=A0A7U3UUD5_9ACTN|nr:hypothetical protein [Streptomyces sp. SN-593]BBA98933.1 hypothetical protein RVR_5333 [Streptomyces sp. SN-593]
MSDLWHVSVRDVTEPSVELLCAAVHPDAGSPSAAGPFVLRLLADAAPVWPGADALVGGADLFGGDLHGGGEAARRADEVFAEVALRDERNIPFDEPAAHRAVEETLRQRGLAPEGDPDEWAAAFGQEWGALWQDPQRVPSGVLRVRFARPSDLAGLHQGLEWDSAAYG